MKVKLLLLLFFMLTLTSCDTGKDTPAAKADSGVTKTSVRVETDKNGNTIEQINIAHRVMNDNKIGAIKHLYIISPYSGQVILYSTVKGKVTSSGKRLNPHTVVGFTSGYGNNNQVNVAGNWHYTNEIIQDDGTYGSSDPYIYWWDTKDVYHQHFMSGGAVVHVSDVPLAVKNIIITVEK